MSLGALLLLLLMASAAAAQRADPTRTCSLTRAVDRWNNCIGTYATPAGDVIYAGDFRNGTFDGYGMLRSADGTYSGQFRNGRFNGEGQLVLPDGIRIIGAFRDGSVEGFARVLDANGAELYAGPFVEGVPANPIAAAAPPPAPAAQPPAAQPPTAPPPAPAASAPPAQASVPAAAPTPPAATPAAPVASPGPNQSSNRILPDGVYLRTQMFGSQLFMSTYRVLGDRIAEAPRKLLGPDEFTPQFASKIGRFRIEGNRILIRWEGEEREINNSIDTGDGCPNFMGGITCPVATFRPGESLSGSFSATASAPNVSSSTRLELNANGTYRLITRGFVVTPDGSGQSENIEDGRYRLSAESSMLLTPNQGTPREVLVFPFPAREPSYLWFEGQMLQGRLERR